jgi:hypothetical protein
VIDSKLNGEYVKVKEDFSKKIGDLDSRVRKQLLFELLTLEINNKK